MDKKIIEYRTKHKKCKWCKYYKYNFVPGYLEYQSYYTCRLKDKVINYERLPRICKYYELNKEKKNED